uniref:thioredoxin-disulfide reductase (NADPH) n=1 Tax=Arcella intermedia TaxID=1963864 RepID=A0A6B2L328_9EUKA
MIVVGGGSGGLAAAKEAVAHQKRVAVCDFVTPSPQGTTWGLGGTCVNVGCIPKKLMHQAALLGESAKDATHFGWNIDASNLKINWSKLVEEVQSHIKSLNFGYKSQLKSENVTYWNEYASFVDPHTIKTVNKKGQQTLRTAENFIIAVGGRPSLPSIPGIEHCITSDDIFSLPRDPGKTLVIGASYVALECAGFLSGFGYDTTVMVRSILLRGFDQEIAEMIGYYMQDHGTKLIRPAIPTQIVKLPDGRLEVTYSRDSKEEKEVFDTVLVATGRYAVTEGLKLKELGVKTSSSHKIYTNEKDETAVPHIHAIGDCVVGKPELTPTAIQAGKLLSKRLFGQSTKLMDYHLVPTTVFTPLEYGTIGLAEEQAIEKYGADNIEVYHAHFQPLEQTIPHRLQNDCYAKLVCNKKENERIVGFHVLSPNAGEITQGFTTALRLGATKADIDDTVGIHPVTAENLVLLNITKRSGKDPMKTGC